MNNGKPVILQVLPALSVGGVERGAIDMAEAVVQAGGRCLVASDVGAMLPRLRYVGGEHRLLSLPKTFSPIVFSQKVKELRSILRDEGVDLVHARSRYAVWVAVIACRKENVPLVTTWHGVHEARHWLKRFYNAGLTKGQRVIAVSSHIAQRLRNEYRVKKEQLVVIPRGSDPELFDPSSVNGVRVQALLDHWDVPDDSKIILMPGRLTPWKGQAILVRALGQLMQKCIDQPWVCVFLGPETNPKFAQSLYSEARALGIEERLRFAGMCDDMPAAYALSTVVVVPSLKPEPFGRVAIEAQMMGRPVIGTAQGGLAESILPYETGMLVPSDDSAALVEAIETLLNTCENRRDRMGQSARKHVLAHYTKGLMQAATLNVYDALLGTRLEDRFEKAQREKGLVDGGGTGRQNAEEGNTTERGTSRAGGSGAAGELIAS
ncbi:glycosyltransferase [Saccharibacter sp. 17.LH.SD]|uniref:glycosyltransferase family 4 protein n=1 Tax=Saccharibacter sp. 17.LH.SD TaxID=2689393 RepID=UPI001369A8C0|nr:glycosyltransferase family 4 protein [Saccharibacter sp. 17.LH.SD]MXV44985.1 glycosyltransferase [Saccharibacter sp. 17.LH.SD]